MSGRWGQEGYGDTGDGRGDSMVRALGTGRLMGGCWGQKGWRGCCEGGYGVMGVPGTGVVMGWPLLRRKALGPRAVGTGAAIGPIPALIP